MNKGQWIVTFQAEQGVGQKPFIPKGDDFVSAVKFAETLVPKGAKLVGVNRAGEVAVEA